MKRAVRMVAIDDLTPYADNARTHPEAQIERIAASIAEYGFTVPVLVDSANVVIAGHGRIAAAVRLGMSEVPVIALADLTPDQVRAYRLADNQLTLLGEWNADLLAVELGGLADVGYDLSLTGFEDDYIKAVLADTSEADNAVVDPPENPVTQPGDLYVLGRHRLICGDCTDPEAVARVLDGHTPRIMVTDPPYGVEYDPNWRELAKRQGLARTYGATALDRPRNDDVADWSPAWALFPGHVAYAWSPPGADSVRHYMALVEAGFQVRAQIVWNKSNFPIGRGHYHYKHEPCWYGVRKGKSAAWIGDRKQSTVWDIPKPSKSDTGHSTQKPVECMERPIRNHRGDVYDPFVGSGTTIIAAERQNRACYAVEIDPGFVDVAVERWRTHTGQEAERIPHDGR